MRSSGNMYWLNISQLWCNDLYRPQVLTASLEANSINIERWVSWVTEACSTVDLMFVCSLQIITNQLICWMPCGFFVLAASLSNMYTFFLLLLVDFAQVNDFWYMLCTIIHIHVCGDFKFSNDQVRGWLSHTKEKKQQEHTFWESSRNSVVEFNWVQFKLTIDFSRYID